MFIAPEAGEVAAEGLAKGTGAVEDAAGTVARKTGTLAREVTQGKNIAQPGAQAAVRTAVGATGDQPIIQGGKSVMDDVVKKFDTIRRDLYSQASEKAGFDVQQTKEQLASAQERLKLTEGTESVDMADQARQQIAELQDKLSGLKDVDPQLLAAADQAHGKYAAAIQFRKAMVRATDVNGTVDVPKLLTASKNLRFTKWGDQLAAFMGKARADEYMQQLEDMRDMGAHAVKVQNFAKWVAKIAGFGLAADAVGHGTGVLQ